MPESDRTPEFHQIAESLQRAKNLPSSGQSRTKGEKSQFFLCAAEIGREIHRTSENLNKLTKLAKRKSLFDDKSEEIEDLTVGITSSLSHMNERLAQLQELQHQERLKQQAGQHNTNVLEALKGKLHTTATDFKGVLKVRSENLKDQEKRRQNFSKTPATPTRSNTHYQQLQESPGLSPGSHHQQQLVVAHSNQYVQDRADMVEQVETHIVELSGIFTQLSTLVAEQEDMLGRIDENVEMTLTNVTGAQEQFMAYYRNISSNRGLVLKMFAVLIFFIVLFGLFM